MPIIGLTDGTTSRLRRLGKFKIGTKNERGLPEKSDHFILPPELAERFGDSAKSLDVELPSNDLDTNFSVFLRQWGNGVLLCKGNGATARKFDPSNQTWTEISCPYHNCPNYPKKCHESGVLSVLVPDVPGLGVYQISTISLNSIKNLQGDMKLLLNTCRGLLGIPLKLTVSPQKSTKGTIYVLGLGSDASTRDMQAAAREAGAQAGRVEVEECDDMPDEMLPDAEPAEEIGQCEPVEDEQTLTLEQNAEIKTLADRLGLRTGFQLWRLEMFGITSNSQFTIQTANQAIEKLKALRPSEAAAFNDRAAKLKEA